MRDGAPLIFQAQLFDGRWQGRTDFLRRIDAPSDLGDHAYEVLDTKLARQVKPAVVHQLALYSRLLARVQGVAPDLAHVILGDGSSVPIELGRYAALHRHVARGLEGVARAPAHPTYPEPVAHCAICQLARECDERRRADDHLSLVADARRDQREKLVVEMALPTVSALAARPGDDRPPPGSGPSASTCSATRPRCRCDSRESGEPRHRHLSPAPAAGYARLPAPSPGDVFFDLEGDPYVGDGGIEYLWGWWTAQDGYECVWAHDARRGEGGVRDLRRPRGRAPRRATPDLHVYHYAPHERSKLRDALGPVRHARGRGRRPAARRGAGGPLRSGPQGMQVGEESYSLKKLERHHGFRRLEESIREGGGSIVAYEQWLETGDAELLEAIRAYNEEDCRSTLALRDWLLERMRPEAEAQLGVDFDDFRDPEPEEEHGPPDWLAGVQALADRLGDGLPAEAEEAELTSAQAERRLLAHLLLYHRREGKPAWWRFFDLRGKSRA